MEPVYGEAGEGATDMIVTGKSRKCAVRHEAAAAPPFRLQQSQSSACRETKGAVRRLQLRIDRLTFRV